MFKSFMSDKTAPYMYITGSAGTGKTTDLHNTIKYCMDKNILYCVCAYTHKAVNVLESKLPEGTELATLHSFLNKIPTVNIHANKLEYVDHNKVIGSADYIQVLFVDEFSMIGNKDYQDIQSMQWNIDGDLLTKVVFLGDLNQLPPVKDAQAVVPSGDYCLHLTKIYRQANTNPLLETLNKLNKYIAGAKPEPLKQHETFIRGVDLVEAYRNNKNSIVLAYTNERVQELNRLIQGKDNLGVGDEVYSPTTKTEGVVCGIEDRPEYINSVAGNLIRLGSKYRTLETVHELGVQFVVMEEVINNNIEPKWRAVVFGHKDYIDFSNKLKTKAVGMNKTIELKHNQNASDWCRENPSTKLSKQRAKAWREFLVFNECVICIDFTHAMTVHKSQGSTYETVIIDTDDLVKCAERNYKLYMQLMYVAISRASKKVFTN